MYKKKEKKDPKIETLSWMGTACMLGSPYLLNYPIGYVLGALGAVFIIPQCYKNGQWNIILLSASSFIGYSLQYLEII
tara:strand:- start:334 stop:567 length:234 start_codon:yes stop_codon:yes gene_type:complete